MNKLRILDYLGELKIRLIYTTLSLSITFVVFITYFVDVFYLLFNNIGIVITLRIITSTPLEVIYNNVIMSIVFAVVCLIPYFSLNFYLYFCHGLYRREQLFIRNLFIYLCVSSLFFLWVLNVWVLPYIFKYLFSDDIYILLPSHTSVNCFAQYSHIITFIFTINVLSFIIVAIPVIVLMVSNYDYQYLSSYSKHRKYLYTILAFILLVFTPPDLVSYSVLLIFFFLSFEFIFLYASIISNYRLK